MSIADFLTFGGIVVSIIFGFFITHFCSIKDTRTRVLKDYYIEQVKSVKVRIDRFFHRVTFGKSSFHKVINWYNHLNIDIKGIDMGVRKSLDLQILEIVEVVDSYYSEITSWDDFNDQYASSHYIPSNEHKEKLLLMKYECDEFLNGYINHINQSNNYPILIIQWKRIKNSYNYYKKKGHKFPFCRSLWERIEKHFFEGLFILAVMFAFFYLINNIELEKKDDIVTPLNNISNKQDSIYREFQLLREKYKPVEIQSIGINNSFFNAENVDSIHPSYINDNNKGSRNSE